VPVANASDANNAGASAAKSSGQNGVTTDALYEFASDAEKYRIQLIGCQNFITKTWEAKNQ
jgi:hypothetical protein